MAAPPPPAQAALPPLGALLGLGGFQRFLVQHERGSWGRAYTVMTHEKRPLFTLRENAGQELWASVGQNAMQAPSSSRLFGLMGRPAKSSIWSIEDVQRGVRGALEVQDHGSATVSTLVDSAGAQILAVHVQRGGLGELTAIATFPDGQPMYGTKGNLMRHSFTVHAPNGAEVAKIHEAFASVHDSYNLDLVAPVDPLSPLVLAILIDREKEIR